MAHQFKGLTDSQSKRRNERNVTFSLLSVTFCIRAPFRTMGLLADWEGSDKMRMHPPLKNLARRFRPMLFDDKHKQRFIRVTLGTFFCVVAFGFAGPVSVTRAQTPDVTTRLNGFDAYMEQLLKDWNAPGIGVGIVVNDKLIFAKGYGYRDYEKKLPFTPTTLFQIASNSKLFTAVAAGLLVEDGKLTWDKPVRETVPAIQFYNDQLNNNVAGACRSDGHGSSVPLQ